MAESKKYLDLAGLTAYDVKLKAWINSSTVDITDDEIRALFATSPYQMVDLGLSVKWANMNVGATSPEENGLYFSWGNVDGHAVDEEGNVVDGYEFTTLTYNSTLGSQFTGEILDAEHDAATVNMGGGWRMPTMDETYELVNNTDHYYIDLEGNILNKDGFIIDESGNTTEDKIELSYSKKLCSICFVRKDEKFIYDYNVDADQRNFIEFPFAGYCYSSLLSSEDLYGYVWSSSFYSKTGMDKARYLQFSSGGTLSGGTVYTSRRDGLSVRGVHA